MAYAQDVLLKKLFNIVKSWFACPFQYNCSSYQNRYAWMVAILKINMAAIPMLQYLFASIGSKMLVLLLKWTSFLVLYILGKTWFQKAAILKSKMVDGCMSTPKVFLKNSVPKIVLFKWFDILLSWFAWPFSTIARYIKIDKLKWLPSWKSIWLPSQ